MYFKLNTILDEATESKAPIVVKFEIPYLTVSGIQVNLASISSMGLNLHLFICYSGEIPKNRRKEWLQRAAMGTVYCECTFYVIGKAHSGV